MLPNHRRWIDRSCEWQAVIPYLDALFSDTIDWPLIETHLPDMLRVVLSIKAGRVTASTLLCKLGAYSKKNKLYQTMRELGRVIRTAYGIGH